ncbi:MAG: hypothetical protein NC038_01165 [Paludibacter sp.]|nr:hypothetical protein [Bacteroidales bacterium]MCM1068818.1 hypothetical protein [Prevotella sp.]MCM1353079.1 hypothetical protein [Bacteroides sp.]MCM1442401.1 hypothetical protein [Muribaculum sp.]MCM1481244.1 hypothetical protein [Paludibacter sp.]
MFVVPKSEITIGSARFYGENAGINAVSINLSIDTIGNTAKVTIPRHFKREDGKGILDYIHTGDKATIRLGYGDNLNTEFEGYLAHIGDGTPLVLDIEDEWYQLRKNKLNKVWEKTTLTEVLQFAFPAYTIQETMQVNLDAGYVIRAASSLQVVKALREQYGFCVHLNPDTQTLHCFYPYDSQGFNTHTYIFGTRDCTLLDELREKKQAPNIVKSDLTFQRKEDLHLQITATSTDRTGKKLTVQVGDTGSDASKRTLHFGSEIQTEQALHDRANAELERCAYDGYTGKITGFGSPQVKAGDAVRLIDPNNPEREGTYLVKAVKITYAVGKGFRRECELSYKIA